MDFALNATTEPKSTFKKNGHPLPSKPKLIFVSNFRNTVGSIQHTGRETAGVQERPWGQRGR